MSVIVIPKPLRDRLGEEATDALTEVIRAIDLDARKDALAIAEERLERRLTEEVAKLNGRLDVLEERLTSMEGRIEERLTTMEGRIEDRFERRLAEETGKVNERITEGIGKINERITEEIGKVNERITEEMGKIRVEMHNDEMGRLRAEIIKWMFIFWIGQIAVLSGILFAIVR